MDITIRNIDKKAYKELKVKAAILDMNIGALVSEAIKFFLKLPSNQASEDKSFANLSIYDWGKETKNLSKEIDQTLYD